MWPSSLFHRLRLTPSCLPPCTLCRDEQAPPDAPCAEPTDAQLDEHHQRVYGGIANAYAAARPFVGLPPSAQLRIQ